MKWEQRTAKNKISQDLIDEFQLSPIQAKLFSLRGIYQKKQLDFWLNADENNLADPYLMHDMDKAVKRINDAIDNGEKITIYGDYDADGITSTTIMVETLGILGADVHYYIPSRFLDGYGPNMDRYQDIVSDGTKLIITVDNGVTGIEEVDFAKKNNVDTIITDHHTFQSEIPDPIALVHCDYPNQNYPFDDYCGAGVAYTICRALMQDTMPELLELAMIGTIGDMVKVSGEGHIIVKRGLEMINETQRPGLLALIKNSGLNLGEITETDIGFNIAPRLNAVGRLDDANLAVQLLLTDDEIIAKELADKIEELNTERKELTSKVFDDCLQQIEKNHWNDRNTLVIFNSDSHEGVLGLVANKVVEEYNKPTIVLTKNEKGEIKGSGRSIPGFNIFNALEPLKNNLLTKFGGHDFACGLSLKEENISRLRDVFEKNFHIKEDLSVKNYDFELPLANLAPQTLTEISLVGPFGTNNPEPIYTISDIEIKSLFKMGKNKAHVRFTAKNKQGSLQIVGFNKGFLNKELLTFINKVYVTLSLNHWQNKTTLQGMLQDIKFGSPSMKMPEPIIDMRKQKYVMGFADRYILFEKNNLNWATNVLQIPESRIAIAQNYDQDNEKIVLLDIPHNLNELEDILKSNYQQLYLRFLIDEMPLKNIPNKSLFSKVLKYVYAHPGLSIASYQDVSEYLNISYQEILFILRVFFELKFIKYEDERVVGIKNPPTQPLTNSTYFRSIDYQLKLAKKLQVMSFNQLSNYIKQFK